MRVAIGAVDGAVAFAVDVLVDEFGGGCVGSAEEGVPSLSLAALRLRGFMASGGRILNFVVVIACFWGVVSSGRWHSLARAFSSCE